MPSPTHLLIDGADRYPLSAIPPLPALRKALQGWQAMQTNHQGWDAPLTPAEALSAQLQGVPDEPGHHPFAALAQGLTDQPCGWITPCRIQLGMDRAQLLDPQELQLGADESRQLMAAVAPLFEELGVSLQYVSELRWLATGELLRDAHCRSLAQAMSQQLRLDALAPLASRQPETARRQIQRLLNEVQMLLYTHPLTDARAARCQTAVNAVWLHGTGVLPAETPSGSSVHVEVDTRLAEAALQGQEAWADAWRALDQELSARLTQWRSMAADETKDCTLSFSGLHASTTWQPTQQGWLAGALRRFGSGPAIDQLLAPLHAQVDD